MNTWHTVGALAFLLWPLVIVASVILGLLADNPTYVAIFVVWMILTAVILAMGDIQEEHRKKTLRKKRRSKRRH